MAGAVHRGQRRQSGTWRATLTGCGSAAELYRRYAVAVLPQKLLPLALVCTDHSPGDYRTWTRRPLRRRSGSANLRPHGLGYVGDANVAASKQVAVCRAGTDVRSLCCVRSPTRGSRPGRRAQRGGTRSPGRHLCWEFVERSPSLLLYVIHCGSVAALWRQPPLGPCVPSRGGCLLSALP